MSSIVSSFWQDQLVEHDRQALFLVLVGFLVSFGFIRLSARLGRSPRVPWWPGSVISDGGVHLHHLVWGICLLLASGVLQFALLGSSPGSEICAVLFGIGAGLTLDEFALWVYLDDVYWAREGRISIDATVIAAAVIGLALLGLRPFDVDTKTIADAVASAIGALALLSIVGVCFAKQRLLHGSVGLFISPLAAYGAARIAKPGSPWARRFYTERNAAKQARAAERFPPERRTERYKERFRDAIGGKTDDAYQAELSQRPSRPRGDTEDS